MNPGLMVAIEAVCLVFMLIILSAYLILPRNKELNYDRFFFSLLFTVLGVGFDLISWTCELVPVSTFVQYSCNFIALVMTNFIISTFAYYITDLLNERRPFPTIFAHIILAANIIAVIVCAAGGFRGTLFDVKIDTPAPGLLTYDDGGFFYEFPMAVGTFSLAFLFILVLYNAKSLGKREIIVFSIYFMIPLAFGILELVDPEMLFAYVGISFSITIVYVLLQSRYIDELMLRDKLLNEISYVDQLTGLLNRRACDRDVSLIEADDKVSIVFCDLNGLKKINDEKGHREGDQFLITFAKILTKHFPYESVYRISGDEFVVVAQNMEPDEFEENIARLRQEIDENAGIAALGTITGTGDTIPALVRKAETRMYDDKKNFYRHNPAYIREQVDE